MAKKKAALAPELTTEMALAEARRAVVAAFPDRADEIMRALERAALPTIIRDRPFRVAGYSGEWLMKSMRRTVGEDRHIVLEMEAWLSRD